MVWGRHWLVSGGWKELYHCDIEIQFIIFGLHVKHWKLWNLYYTQAWIGERNPDFQRVVLHDFSKSALHQCRKFSFFFFCEVGLTWSWFWGFSFGLRFAYNRFRWIQQLCGIKCYQHLLPIQKSSQTDRLVSISELSCPNLSSRSMARYAFCHLLLRFSSSKVWLQ